MAKNLDITKTMGNNATKEETNKCYFCGKVATIQYKGHHLCYHLCGHCAEKLTAMLTDYLNLGTYETPVEIIK